MNADHERAIERRNSVYNICTDANPDRRRANRLLYLLAKTYWRNDPNELERALSYELEGHAHSEQAKRILSGEGPWTPEEEEIICRKYRVKPDYFTCGQEETKKATDEEKAKPPNGKVAKVKVFGSIGKKTPVQQELDLGEQTPKRGMTRVA